MRNMKNDMIMPKGNKMNRSGIHRWMVVLMVALFALPVMAGWITRNDNPVISSAYAFQSTSTMQGAGSAYSSNPAGLNEDGQATYSDPESSLTPAYAPSKRRNAGENDDWASNPEGGGGAGEIDEGSPIGDAVLPLLLMAAAAAGVIAYRRRRLQPAE